MRDNFREREVWRFNIKVAFDDLQVRGDLAEEVVGFFVGQVA